jgi:hypothetical protein
MQTGFSLDWTGDIFNRAFSPSNSCIYIYMRTHIYVYTYSWCLSCSLFSLRI